MAFKAGNITMTGAAQSLASGLGLTPPSTLCMAVYLENTASNAAVKVGDSGLTATVYGFLVEPETTTAVRPTVIGPFSGGSSPLNLNEIFVLGTNSQILHVAWVTQ